MSSTIMAALVAFCVFVSTVDCAGTDDGGGEPEKEGEAGEVKPDPPPPPPKPDGINCIDESDTGGCLPSQCEVFACDEGVCVYYAAGPWVKCTTAHGEASTCRADKTCGG